MIEILIYLSLGAFTGLLAGMFGIGGGSILVPSLIFIFYGMGFEASIIVLMAIGTSLASIFFSAISSALCITTKAVWNGHWLCHYLLA